MLDVPAGVEGILEVFGSAYKVVISKAWRPITTPAGIHGRLQTLGYQVTQIGQETEETERAVLNFQADNSLAADGTISHELRNKLKKLVSG